MTDKQLQLQKIYSEQIDQHQERLIEQLLTNNVGLDRLEVLEAVQRNGTYHHLWCNPHYCDALLEVCNNVFTIENVTALTETDLVVELNHKLSRIRNFPRLNSNWLKKLLKKYESNEIEDTLFFDNYVDAALFVEIYRRAINKAKLHYLHNLETSKFPRDFDKYSFFVWIANRS
jgi:hypothetical protein